MSKTFCQVIFYLEDRYFPPPWYIHLLYFFFWKVHIFISRKEWIDSINYLIKIGIFLVFIVFLNLPFRRSARRCKLVKVGDLIDQVDRERGANRNQSRGIQFIHAKRLTYHPNTRSSNGLLTIVILLFKLSKSVSVPFSLKCIPEMLVFLWVHRQESWIAKNTPKNQMLWHHYDVTCPNYKLIPHLCVAYASY